ncbi:MAG: tetratricopeptide repeat protein [Pseudanabaenales cyanobacterium]|nr:tetratricopeptide repeat protein [Pseudanabaenales cyanobacterium]
MPSDSYCHPLTRLTLTLGALIATATPVWSQTRGNNYIYGIQGNVVFGRYLITPDSAFEGAVVSTYHQIRVEDANSQVTLACSNSTTHALTTGAHAVSTYCPARNNGRPGPRNPPRDPFNPILPYVISPRNTALLNAENVTLRWHPVADANQYQVTITGPGVNWRTQVNQPQVTYAGPEPLQPDYRYRIVITADNELSSEAGLTVGFTVLPPAEVERVTSQAQQIEALQLEPDIRAIALALMYAAYEHSDPDRQSYALNQLAIDVLQERIEAGADNSQIYLLQADIYLTVGLPLLAGEQYLKALPLSERSNLREQQAQSYVGLGTIAEGQTEYADAIRYFQAAQTLYETLEYVEQVENLTARLARLAKEIDPAQPSESEP